MLMQGLVLLVVGVGIVFLFLSLLVCILSLSAKIIPKFNYILPDEQPRAKAQKAKTSGTKSSPEEEIAVAIAAAVAHQQD